MCGIAGIMTVDGTPPELSTLDALEKALSHRGPDGVGRYAHADVALVHTRLAIIDLKTGAHPLIGHHQTALVGNGEIYNDPELRHGRLALTSFATGSDCESILHLYEKDGLEAVKELRGMYAFALHDRARDCLILARDPFGIKPCYYAETAIGFVFASEPQALIAAGLLNAELARHPIVELLQLQFTTGAETIFQGINRLLPGELLVVRAGRIVERHRREALPAGRPVRISESDALERLDNILLDSVRVHQRSDVPYGLFLSSGIDSTAILACMAKLNSTPVEAFTASFPGSGLADEFPDAHRVAMALGARHQKVDITAADFFALLPEIAACVDDPTADYAVVPTYILAREAAKSLKVILCGEGGDEMFAGYGRYRRQIRPRWLGGRVRRRSGPFSNHKILRIEFGDWRSGIAASELACGKTNWSALQRAQAVDCVDFLPDGLLNKLDRCLMAHGIEGRTPLLDPLVADFAFRLPKNLQLGRQRGKYLLRRWLEKHVPQSQSFARKKGFTVPVGAWIAAVGAKLGPLVANDPAVAAVSYPEAVKSLFTSSDRHDLEAAWRLLFYSLWHRRHIRGVLPDGDVFHCLAG